MRSTGLYGSVYAGFSLALLLLLIFAGLHWLGIPTGRFLDWIIGTASFIWLITIVTVPWNIYFEAKETLAEAQQSEQQGISIAASERATVQLIAKRSLLVVLVLHALSAIVFYGLAITGISGVGYFGSIAALLLTLLRPAIRTYQYFAMRLQLVRQQFKYPREGVVELRQQVSQLVDTVRTLEQRLDLDQPNSWISTQQRQWEALRNDLTTLAVNQEELKVMNQADHERLVREAQQSIAQLTLDGQFLDHVREIIRFFKAA